MKSLLCVALAGLMLLCVVRAEPTCIYDLYYSNGTDCLKQDLGNCFKCSSFYYMCEAENDGDLECREYYDSSCSEVRYYVYPDYDQCNADYTCSLFYAEDQCTELMMSVNTTDVHSIWVVNYDTNYYGDTGPLYANTNGTTSMAIGEISAIEFQVSGQYLRFETALPGTNQYETNFGICDFGTWCNNGPFTWKVDYKENVTTSETYNFIFDFEGAVGINYAASSADDIIEFYISDDQQFLLNIDDENDFTGYTFFTKNTRYGTTTLKDFEFYAEYYDDDGNNDVMELVKSGIEGELKEIDQAEWWFGWWFGWWFDWWFFNSEWWDFDGADTGVITFTWSNQNLPEAQYGYASCNAEYDELNDFFYYACDFDANSSFWWWW